MLEGKMTKTKIHYMVLSISTLRHGLFNICKILHSLFFPRCQIVLHCIIIFISVAVIKWGHKYTMQFKVYH